MSREIGKMRSKCRLVMNRDLNLGRNKKPYDPDPFLKGLNVKVEEIVDNPPVPEEEVCEESNVVPDTDNSIDTVDSVTIAATPVKEDLLVGRAAEIEDLTGSILELEKEEVSTPKGSRKGKLPESPAFSGNENWIKPEILLEDMWNKKRTLKAESDSLEDFKLPVDESVILSENVWEIPELVELKVQLNEVKSTLDNFPLNAWHNHTKAMNISHLIVQYVRRYFNPEFSSQAWGKMFEILCSYDIIPNSVLEEGVELKADERRMAAEERIPFDSIHLCEAPGAFVSALNHFMKISFPEIDWNWLATTLNPYHEGNDVGKMINDDRLILMSTNHWTFLEDQTGNILSVKNVNKLVDQQQEKLNKPRVEKGQTTHRVLLVTADGSIDCQTNPAEQESTVVHLQFGEIIAALKLLQPEGSFVLKIFTFLEAATISHLYLLSCAFREVHLFKPSTSKEGNSEVYVICLGFLGDSKINSLVENLLYPQLENYGSIIKSGKVLLPLASIPPLFIDRIKESANFFCNYQMKIIKRNASCFPCDNRMYQIMKLYRKEAAEQWVEWSEITKLLPEQRLFTADDEVDATAGKRVGGAFAIQALKPSCHLDLKEEQGCFADKLRRLHGHDIEKVMFLRAEIPLCDWQEAENRVLYACPIKTGPIAFEKPYENIISSRFCYGKVLSVREEIRDIAKNYVLELEKQGIKNMENICKGHDVKQVLVSMHKSCDPVLDKKNMEVLCFKKTTWSMLTQTDFQQQQRDLREILEKVKQLGIDQSIFLCRFPILSRLQAGLICSLTGLFEKTIIYGDVEKNVAGILLYKFNGLIHPDQKNLLRAIDGILSLLVNKEFHWPVLQIVPMKTLIEFMPVEFILRYNLLLLSQDMNRMLNVTECAVRSSLENAMLAIEPQQNTPVE